MGKINVLGFEIANLIAAGEVVDRPASVLKELLENSIDAGATEITAEIKNGGVSMIRVSDNGSGIAPEDMPVAIRRHATSKISSADDLSTIMTLGFRGEALAAISSVCEMKILSKTKDNPSGTLLVSSDGNVTEISEVGCADGTTVIVENLFGAVPARRKFLKKDVTEAAAAAATVEKIAMSRPDIAIRLLIDGNEKFATSGDGKLQNALYSLLGRDFATRLLPIEGENGGIRVSGFVGRSDNARGNRNSQNTFINQRFVKSKTVSAALERAFNSYIAPEKFPVAVVFLTCDPLLVDVNVHPAKLEVRFSNEQAVFEAVYYAVRGALEENKNRPDLTLDNNRPGRKTTYVVDNTSDNAGENGYRIPNSNPTTYGNNPISVKTVTGSVKESQYEPPVTVPSRGPSIRTENGFGGNGHYVGHPSKKEYVTPSESNKILSEYADLKSKTEPFFTRETVSKTSPFSNQFQTVSYQEKPKEIGSSIQSSEQITAATASGEQIVSSFRYIGDAFRTYLFVELDGEMMIIDQHAAHERLLFEEMKEIVGHDGRIASQSLLLPIEVSLGYGPAAAAEEYREDLEKAGFDFYMKGAVAVVTAIPSDVDLSEAEDLFTKLTDQLEEGRGNPTFSETQRRERALYQVACKAAIKGGRQYAPEQLAFLAEKVIKNPSVTVCPHGRPIAVRLTKEELDRRFDRIK